MKVQNATESAYAHGLKLFNLTINSLYTNENCNVPNRICCPCGHYPDKGNGEKVTIFSIFGH